MVQPAAVKASAQRAPAVPERQSEPQASPRPPLRFVTAASLFDGHDASINIMRRILQSSGAEVIHLGHNRSVEEVVGAALYEDADAIAVSSYQGGHVEYFQYMVDMLRERDGSEIRVFGGGGGVIVPEEVRTLHEYGVTRLYSPADGQQLGLQGMIDDMLERTRGAGRTEVGAHVPPTPPAGMGSHSYRDLARLITACERDTLPAAWREWMVAGVERDGRAPVVGITGTGGAGKSSLTDEVVRRFRLDYADQLTIGILAVDPSRRRSGGALLGDRIRMNSIDHEGIYLRSIATRGSGHEVPAHLADMVALMRAWGFDLVVVETSGIGQGDAAIVPFVDVSMYVMTPEFGAASQLEKIDMLDFADLVAINKFDRKGAADALRDVRKQIQRNQEAFHTSPELMPVYGTVASHFNDDGVTALYQGLQRRLRDSGFGGGDGECARRLPDLATKVSTRTTVIVPPARQRYLAEVAETVRAYHHRVGEQSRIARERQQLSAAKRMLVEAGTRDRVARPPSMRSSRRATSGSSRGHATRCRPGRRFGPRIRAKSMWSR